MSIIILLIVILFVLYFIAGLFLSRMMSFPRLYSMKDAEIYEKTAGNWGNFDSLKKEDFLITSYDGYELHATFIPAKPRSNKFVIISHGWTYNRLGSVKYIHLFHSLNFNCIAYDNRGHGENKRYACSEGFRESKDLLSVIDFVKEKYSPSVLGLHGESMGSALTLIALKNKPAVDFAVLDCGFYDLKKLIKTVLKTKARVPFFFYYGATLMSRIFHGFFIGSVRPIDSLPENDIPLCFIHGEADDFIPCEHSKIMNEKNRGYSELHLIKDAGHAKALDTDRKEYYRIVREFVSKLSLPGDPK